MQIINHMCYSACDEPRGFMTSKYKQLRKVLLRSFLFSVVLFLALSGLDIFQGVTAKRPKVRVETEYYFNVMAFDRVVALTFDDGPDPVKTKEILDVLKKHEVPATFFFLGSKALKYPEIVRLVHQSQYEIGNHSFSHSGNVHSSEDRLNYELDLTNKIIGNITYEPTILYRPPFLLDIGSDPPPDRNDHLVSLDWAMNAGYIPIGADIDSLDWQADSAEEIVENVLSNLENGHIILMHDGAQSQHTAQALDLLIPELKSRDYRFETVSDVIGLNAIPDMIISTELMFGLTDEVTNGDVTRLQTFLLKKGFLWHEPTGFLVISRERR